MRSIPFDLAHIAGNVLFALAAGPALVAALRRFRERFEWNRVPGTVGAVVIAVALSTVVLAPAPAEAKLSDQARKARAWLEGSQNRDGGFGTSRTSQSSVTITARAAIGFAAAGRNPFDVTRSSRSPIGYLTSKSKSIKSPGDISLTILALHSAGADPRKFAGRNLVSELDSKRRRDRTFGNKVNVAAWAALAFRAAKASGAASSVLDWLKSVQGPGNQGWGISSSAASDPDSTGTVLQLLGRGGRTDRALTWLAGIQRGSGGFSGMGSVPTVNTQSTGLVLQGLAGLGYGPGKLTKDGRTGLDFLKARQRASGAVDYSAGNDQTPVWVTADALVALSGKSLPVKGPRRKPVVPSSNGPSGGGSSPCSGGDSSGGSSAGSGSGGGQGSGSDSSVPGGSGGQGDDQSGGLPVPDGDSLVPDGASPFATTPVAPSAELLDASRAGPSPSAALALLIGLGMAGLVVAGVTFLVRRKRW